MNEDTRVDYDHLNSDEQKYHDNDQEYREKWIGQLEPVNLNVEVSTVVIASAELENDNFWRMLYTASTQRGVDYDTFEIVYVVNQRKVTQDRRKEQVSELSRMQENQDSLYILARLTNVRVGEMEISEAVDLVANRLGGRFSEHERRVFVLAAKRGIKIVPVNMTENEKITFFSDRDSIKALARDVGGHAACGRLEQTESGGGLIDFVDGDCEFSRSYFRNLVKAARQSKVEVVLKPMKPVLTGDVEFPPEVSELTQVVTMCRYFAVASFAGVDMYTDLNRSTDYVSGPQIALSPGKFRQNVGYAYASGANEDFKFSARVLSLSRSNREGVEIMPDVVVYVGERVRFDSVDGLMRHNDVVEAHENDLLSALKFVRSEVDSLELLKLQKWLDQVVGKMKLYQEPFEEICTREYKLEIVKRAHNQRMLRELVAVVCEGRSVENYFNEQKSLRGLDYIRGHKNYEMFLHKVVEAVAVKEGKENLELKVWARLEMLLPEYFGPILDEQPDYGTVLAAVKSGEMQGINIADFIHIPASLFRLEQAVENGEIRLGGKPPQPSARRQPH